MKGDVGHQAWITHEQLVVGINYIAGNIPNYTRCVQSSEAPLSSNWTPDSESDSTQWKRGGNKW